MLMIDENTSRDDLLTAIYRNGELLDYFFYSDKYPEFMGTEEIRNMVIAWIETGDETHGG